jgi:hypothetical protein
MNIRRTLALTATVLIPLAVGVPAAATTSSDTTPPILRTPATPKFVTSYQMAPAGQDDGCGVAETAVKIHWSASDPSTPITYKLRARDTAEDVTTIFRHSSRTSYQSNPNDGLSYANTADTTCGGDGGARKYYYVRARDAAGNSARNTIYDAGQMSVTEQDGNPWGMRDWGPIPTINYSSGWSASTCFCYHNYDAIKTTVKGASATFQLPYTTDGQSHLALVMSVGPKRGSFDLYIGGVFKKCVSTYAPVSEDRIVVANVSVSYNASYTPNGVPPVTIVNRATPGHPKLTLDAVLTN